MGDHFAVHRYGNRFLTEKLRSRDIGSFREDILRPDFFNTEFISSAIDAFVEENKDRLTPILDKHAPLIYKTIT